MSLKKAESVETTGIRYQRQFGSETLDGDAERNEALSVDEMLINAVKEHSVIYSPKNKGRSPKITEKAEAWTNVVESLQGEMDLKTAKHRWRTLRDRYVRLRGGTRKARIRGPAAVPKKAPWVYYKLLSFLDDSSDRPPLISNAIDGNSCLSKDVNNSYRSFPKSRLSGVTESQEICSESKESIGSLKDSHPKISQRPLPHELTEIDGFGIMIVNKLKKLPDSLIPDVMLDVMTRIHTAERMAKVLDP